MSFETFLLWFLIGLMAGVGLIVRGNGFGLIGNTVVGLAGAFIGGWLFGQLDFSLATDVLGGFVAVTAGAVMLVLLIGVMRRA